MKIAYYMPLKPMGHPHPSGDLVTGTEIHHYLNEAGHDCRLVSTLRCRWLYLRPWKWLALALEWRRVFQRCRQFGPDIWLSYHSYYKAPDLLGPSCAARLGIPYVVFQGIYSTKRRRRLTTLPGFYLNRHALKSAAMVFTNKRRDEHNLLRLLPSERVCYIAPGIHTSRFTFSSADRERIRRRWGIGEKPVVMAAAMFRPGVKTQGLKTVIEACGSLLERGRQLKLVIAGDGDSRAELQALANRTLAGNVIFCGQVPRDELAAIYSAADIFAFPGIEESLGMVYLEAQSCGLPVVACRDWGGGEAVIDGWTGLLSPAAKPHAFIENIGRLLQDAHLRRQLGRQAAASVRELHELQTSYALLESTLAQTKANRSKKNTPAAPD